ncbi:MAG: hypothetical protein HY099_00975, partial [Nitrospirae bacterium]|nr:hypothetical protein [Nitrospirota bacterium]
MKRQRKKVLKILLAVAAVLVLSVVFLIYNANRILKYELERRLGKDFSIERISLGLGGVDALGIKLAKANEVFLQADKL